jgi:hypothetical protein
VQPGTKVYSRKLTLPSSIPLGTYKVVGGLWEANTNNQFNKINLGYVLEIQ